MDFPPTTSGCPLLLDNGTDRPGTGGRQHRGDGPPGGITIPMLGQIFFSLQKFIQRRLGPEAWSRLFAEAGIAPKMYFRLSEYPDEEAVGLLLAASRLADRPVQELLEVFGVDLAKAPADRP